MKLVVSQIDNRVIKEFLLGDCELVWDDFLGQFLRIVRVARIAVYYRNLRLVEYQQILKDGSRRFRNFKYVSEKVHVGESFYNGAIRGIKEELGLDAANLVYQGVALEEKISGSYPNLMCRYQFFDYRWEMPDEVFNPQGYIANEDNTTTYFQWEIAE